MVEENPDQSVDMDRGNTRRALYDVISSEFGEGGVGGLGEHLERVYRGLYQLTIDHPRFSRALERQDQTAIRVKEKLEAYGEEVQSIKQMIIEGRSYEGSLAALTIRLKSWANIIEEKYREFASNLVSVVQETELQLEQSVSFRVLMRVNELMKYAGEIKASVEQARKVGEEVSGLRTELTKESEARKPRDADVLLKIDAALGRLGEIEKTTTQILGKQYGLSDADVEKVKGIVSEAVRGVQIDYQKVGELITAALVDVPRKTDLAQAVAGYPTEKRLAEIFAEAARVVTVQVTSTIDAPAIDKSVRDAVGKALEGKVTVQVDDKALDAAVRNALSGVKEELGRYIQGEISQAVGRLAEGLRSPPTIDKSEDEPGNPPKPRSAGPKSPRKKGSSGRPEGDSKAGQTEAAPPEPEGDDDVNADEFLDNIFKKG